LPLAYQNYYTHDEPTDISHGVLARLYQALLWATGLTRQRAGLRSMCLADTSPGRLLEVGCGTGEQLARLRERGWEVEGQEVDAKAAERAQALHGLRVHLGTLTSLALQDAAYDAVAMNHVIEHVRDPVALLKECHRILKPGGIFVAITPNIDSYGHHYFGSCWRGLDPPRHLHLLSAQTLGQTAERAGFCSCECWTTAARAVGSALGSLDIQCCGRHQIQMTVNATTARKVQAVLFQLWAALVHLFRPDSGEECVIRAWK
jgi:SAM-dependent methyltransferase